MHFVKIKNTYTDYINFIKTMPEYRADQDNSHLGLCFGAALHWAEEMLFDVARGQDKPAVLKMKVSPKDFYYQAKIKQDEQIFFSKKSKRKRYFLERNSKVKAMLNVPGCSLHYFDVRNKSLESLFRKITCTNNSADCFKSRICALVFSFRLNPTKGHVLALVRIKERVYIFDVNHGVYTILDIHNLQCLNFIINDFIKVKYGKNCYLNPKGHHIFIKLVTVSNS